MILNLTQHKATLEQLEADVNDLPESMQKYLAALLTFETIPSIPDMEHRAKLIVSIVPYRWYQKVMIGGAPFFMSTLERVLKENGLVPVYAFSERVSREETLPDGTVKKVNEFRHKGFVEV